MTVPLSKRDRKRKFKNLAFAALNRSAEGKTTCVQVGAHDGKRWDPVFGHITQNGWNALVIEPDPIYFERLSENYADYPNVTPDKCGNFGRGTELFVISRFRAYEREIP